MKRPELGLSGVRTSFVVEKGKKTNRVRASRAREVETSPQRALTRYVADPTLRGKLLVNVCISLPVEELAELDELAAVRRMSRSHLLRAVAKLYIEFARSGGEI